LKEVKISPKSIMNFPLERIEGKGVDQSVIQHLETIQKNISVVSQVPMKLLTAEMDGSLSGVALARLMSGVTKQAEVRRDYLQSIKPIRIDPTCKVGSIQSSRSPAGWHGVSYMGNGSKSVWGGLAKEGASLIF
jgi:hypothetical protein